MKIIVLPAYTKRAEIQKTIDQWANQGYKLTHFTASRDNLFIIFETDPAHDLD